RNSCRGTTPTRAPPRPRVQPRRRSPRPCRARRVQDRCDERAPSVGTSGQQLLRLLDPLEALLLAENLEGFVERRADLSSGDRHADDAIQITLRPPKPRGEAHEGGLDVGRNEWLDLSEDRASSCEGFEGGDPVALLRNQKPLVETNVVREEESDQLLSVLQRLHSFLDVRADPRQDRAIPFGGHERFKPSDELIHGEPPDPNAVEIVEAFLRPLAAGPLTRLGFPYPV